LVRSKLIEITWDKVSEFEQLVFNYTISDNTLIEGVKTLSAASKIKINENETTLSEYWDFKELLGNEIVSFANSIELLDEILSKVISIILKDKGFFGASLTGGWDGRLLLSYIMKDYSHEDFFLYSFGANSFEDISIPNYISKELGLTYYPHHLDNEYISKFGRQAIKETITSSSGTRNYLRSHYYYSMLNNSMLSGSLISVITLTLTVLPPQLGQTKAGEGLDLLSLIHCLYKYIIGSMFKNYSLSKHIN